VGESKGVAFLLEYSLEELTRGKIHKENPAFLKMRRVGSLVG